MRTQTIALLLNTAIGFSQTKNTLVYMNAESNQATLSEGGWVQGPCKKEVPAGVGKKIWSHPPGDSILYSFKTTFENKVKFCERDSLNRTRNTSVLQLKYSDVWTFEHVSETQMDIFFIMHSKKRKSKRSYK